MLRGMSIIELVVATAIILTVVVGASSAWQVYLKTANLASQQTQAVLAVGETEEAINFLRDQSWTSNIAPLSLGTPYYVYWNGTNYTITSVATTTSTLLTVKTVFSAVYRDVQSNISSSGTTDAGTRQATISVYGPTSSSTTLMQGIFLVHNLYDN